jgi:Fur family zinc uptake transcriptional regulator
MQADILSILRQHAEPLSAYDLLAIQREKNPKIAPPTIYRALAALAESGRVHRLESLNAYIACQCDGPKHASILSICDDCGTVEETVAPDVLERLSGVIGQSGFSPLRHVIEVHGLCASCGTPEGASA